MEWSGPGRGAAGLGGGGSAMKGVKCWGPKEARAVPALGHGALHCPVPSSVGSALSKDPGGAAAVVKGARDESLAIEFLPT